MAEEQRFTVHIESDEERPLRYRWTISQDAKLYSMSRRSYATRREAEAEAAKTLKDLSRRTSPRDSK